MPTLGTRGGGSVRGFGRFGGGRPSQITTIAATDVGSGRAYNNGRIDISWTAPSSNGAPITGYLIERSTNSGSTFSTLVANTGSDTSTYSDTGLSSAQRYDYRVSAINAIGTAIASSSVNATATTVPQAPTVGAASRAADNQVSLTFTANATGGSNITSYTIVGSPSISVSTNAGTTSPRTATASYGSGTSYTFTIAAVNANGTSAASAASGSVMPNQPAPSSVEYVVVAGGGTGADPSHGGPSGGGGGGGAMNGTQSVNSGTNYFIAVGGAGGGSQFASFSTIGGGNGARGAAGGNGGSGGGTLLGQNSRGRGTAGQGHDGGWSTQSGTTGGGGGYGGVGGNGRRAIDPSNGTEFIYSEPGQAGEGGGALATNINGTTEYYAYGGGGFGPGYYSIWATNGDGSSKPANSGGGGGGFSNSTLSGGSGVVILAYNSNAKDAVIDSGLGYNRNVNSRPGYKVYYFTHGAGNVSW